MEITKAEYEGHLRKLTADLGMVPPASFDLWLDSAGVVTASEKIACELWRTRVGYMARDIWVRMFLNEIHDNGSVEWKP